jgi:predicted RNase H-like HicB family nuclease
MIAYPIRIVPGDDGGVIAAFPDIPEAESRGADEDEAVGGALAALEKALAVYVADGRPIPAPSDICGAPTVKTARFSLIGLES